MEANDSPHLLWPGYIEKWSGYLDGVHVDCPYEALGDQRPCAVGGGEESEGTAQDECVVQYWLAVDDLHLDMDIAITEVPVPVNWRYDDGVHIRPWKPVDR